MAGKAWPLVGVRVDKVVINREYVDAGIPRCDGKCDCGNDVIGLNRRALRTYLQTKEFLACDDCALNARFPETGFRCGHLVVKRKFRRGDTVYVETDCDCGRPVEPKSITFLRSMISAGNRSLSCRKCAFESKIKPVGPGDRFGHLVVREVLGSDMNRMMVCDCDCGRKNVKRHVNTMRSSARAGNASACGKCSKVPEYKIWSGIKERCFYEYGSSYESYGAAGITMSDAWKNDFYQFYKDMGPRPSANHSIDRYPDGAGPYRADNCRWATLIEQARNKKSNVRYDFQGQLLILSEISELTGMPAHRIRARLKRGWSIADATTIAASQDRTPRYEFEGKLLTLKEWASDKDICYYTLHTRLAKGLPIHAILSERIRGNKSTYSKP